jgi:ankyrin repeat protein
VLIELGADIQAQSTAKFTPLLFAALSGNVELMKLLLDAGAAVNHAATDGSTALLLATVKGHVATAELLLGRGADPNRRGPGYTPLHWASGLWLAELPDIYGRNERLVTALIDHKADPNARLVKAPSPPFSPSNARLKANLVGATPLILAAGAADVGIIRALLARGADPALTTNDKSTALMFATGFERITGASRVTESAVLDTVRVLLEVGADVNAANNAGDTALHAAAYTGADRVVEYLVQRGANINARNKIGKTALGYAQGGYLVGTSVVVVNESTAQVLKKLGAVSQ